MLAKIRVIDRFFVNRLTVMSVNYLDMLRLFLMTKMRSFHKMVLLLTLLGNIFMGYFHSAGLGGVNINHGLHNLRTWHLWIFVKMTGNVR